VEKLNSPSLEFHHLLTLIDSDFRTCEFAFAYFEKGLIIEGCVFESYLDFQAGGHNKNHAFTIKNSTFSEFVNFFDCWFQNTVEITGNEFKRVVTY